MTPNNDNENPSLVMEDDYEQEKTARRLMVRDFYVLAGRAPTAELANRLIQEECLELHAAATHALKELMDVEYVVAGAIEYGFEIDEDTKAFINRVVHLFRLVDFETSKEAFRRVHESNISKLEGMERDPETGKILKGPNYHPPILGDLI